MAAVEFSTDFMAQNKHDSTDSRVQTGFSTDVEQRISLKAGQM